MVNDDDLKVLYARYLAAQKKYEDTIVFNHSGTRVSYHNSALKGSATKAYGRFSRLAESMGMTTQDIINYHSEHIKQS